MTDMDADGLTLTNETGDPLLTPKEAARALRMKTNTLAKWRCTDPERLPFVKVGRSVRYRCRDVVQLTEAGQPA